MAPPLAPLVNPICPWSQNLGWQRGWTPRPEPTRLEPSVTGGRLRFLLRSDQDKEPWEDWRASQSPQGLPFLASTARLGSSPALQATQPALHETPLRPGVLRNGRTVYERQERRFGRPASWQTSSNAMHEQTFGKKAFL